MPFRRVSLVLLFLGAWGVAACSGDDSAALPLPEGGATATGDGAAHEGGSVDASPGSDGSDGGVVADAVSGG